jgi:hypothetical protein
MADGSREVDDMWEVLAYYRVREKKDGPLVTRIVAVTVQAPNRAEALLEAKRGQPADREMFMYKCSEVK